MITATFKPSLQASTVTPSLPAKREQLIQMKALNIVFIVTVNSPGTVGMVMQTYFALPVTFDLGG